MDQKIERMNSVTHIIQDVVDEVEEELLSDFTDEVTTSVVTLEDLKRAFYDNDEVRNHIVKVLGILDEVASKAAERLADIQVNQYEKNED